MLPETHPQSEHYRFLITDKTRGECDISDLIYQGAKFSIIVDYVRHVWAIPKPKDQTKQNDWLYSNIYRTVSKWQKAGLIKRSKSYVYDTSSVELSQRPGVFIVAANTPNKKTTNLIKSLQNSKTLIQAQNEEIGEKLRPHIAVVNGVVMYETNEEPTPTTPPSRKNLLPTGKISWFRIQAIRKLQKIRDSSLFVRKQNSDGIKTLNPKLTQAQKEISNLFEVWKKDVSKKSIVLRENNASGRYLVMPYKTRFTDPYRHWENEKTYRTAIKKSLELFENGLFITLTTDPQIQMRPLGEEFERHVKDPDTGKTYCFEVTGQGNNLWGANRSESRAFRGWYEKLCHRYGFRIPYIRVVEFQKNGLIHTHLMFFGIEWGYTWEQLARDWGETYSQGIMNQVYPIVKKEGVWQWASKKEQPTDTKGRTPADYLGKYLKKASDIPTIKCQCGEICSSPNGEDIICPKCGKKHKAPADGRYMYWAMNKRFFTMSRCLRDFNSDEELQKFSLKKIANEINTIPCTCGETCEAIKGTTNFVRCPKCGEVYKIPVRWLFVGTPDTDQVKDYVRKDARSSHLINAKIGGKGWDIKPPETPEERKQEQLKRFIREENPDINDDDPIEIFGESIQEAEVIEITTAKDEYARLLEIEAEMRKLKRQKMKAKSELKTPEYLLYLDTKEYLLSLNYDLENGRTIEKDREAEKLSAIIQTLRELSAASKYNNCEETENIEQTLKLALELREKILG